MSPVGEAPAWLSHSQVSILLQCGEQYRLQRILRAPQVPAWYFIGGSVVHGVTENLDHDVIAFGEFWSPETIQVECDKMFNALIDVAKAEEPDTPKWGMGGRANAKEGEDWWRTNAPKMVSKWQDWAWGDNGGKGNTTLEIWTLPNGDPAIELNLNPIFGGQPVKMAIDRVYQSTATGELIVVDIKAGSREPAGGYQLALYAEAIHRMFGVKVTWGSYWMARKGELTHPKDLTKLIGDLDDRFAKARMMIDQEMFLAVPSMLCGSCSVREFCVANGGDPSPLLGSVS